MALTDLEVKRAKATDKPQKLADGGGLYLLVQPNGAKYWRLDYRFAGKRKTLALGVYPDVSLSEARERREAARKVLANGADPGAVKQAQKAAKTALAENSFEIVAREWFSKHSPNWAASHASKIITRLENDVFPWLGQRPIGEISPPELLAVLRRTESRGALDTAHRALQNCAQVFRYALATGRAQRNPAADLKGALPPVKGDKHFASVTDPQQVGELLRAIDGFRGTFPVQCALRLAPMVFVRPGELRKAEWAEIDLDKAEWNIPAERMKMREPHLVPLSAQAVEILRELHALTGHGRHVFPGRDPQKPMSDAAVNAALRRMGYDTKTEIRNRYQTVSHLQGNRKMNSIQTLVAELKQKLSLQARADLERMIATPEAQAILARDEGEQLENRRVLVAAMKMVPGKYALEKKKTAEAARITAEAVTAAESVLADAKVAFGAATAAASVPGWRENAELFAMERELLEGCDPRLNEFAAHVGNLAQVVGHSIVVWPMHQRNWITRERSVVYESNTAEVTSLRQSLAECVAECLSMRMEALSFSEITSRLAVWTEVLREPLQAFSLPCPRVDETGTVKLDGEKLSATAMTERAISTARGVGKPALAA